MVDESKASGDQDLVSDEIKKTDIVSYETHKKLLAEKKAMQQKALELETRLKAIEEKELEQKGQSSELINSLRTRLQEKEQALEKTARAFTWKQLESAVKSEALRHGCLEPSKLIKLIDDEDLQGIEIKDDFTINQEDLATVMDKAKKSNPFLFKKADVSIVDGIPRETKVKQKSIDDMSTKELEELIKRAETKK